MLTLLISNDVSFGCYYSLTIWNVFFWPEFTKPFIFCNLLASNFCSDRKNPFSDNINNQHWKVKYSKNGFICVHRNWLLHLRAILILKSLFNIKPVNYIDGQQHSPSNAQWNTLCSITYTQTCYTAPIHHAVYSREIDRYFYYVNFLQFLVIKA